jgi:hypothetical protein
VVQQLQHHWAVVRAGQATNDGHYWIKGISHKNAPTIPAKIEKVVHESNFERYHDR